MVRVRPQYTKIYVEPVEEGDALISDMTNESTDELAVEGAQFFGGAQAKEVFLDGSEEMVYTNGVALGPRREALFKSPEAAAVGIAVERGEARPSHEERSRNSKWANFSLLLA